MNSRKCESDEKNNNPHALIPCEQGSLRVAVIVEDLRLPLDEGAKKTSFSIITSFTKVGTEVSTFTCYGNPLLENVFPLPTNKLLFGSSFARSLNAQAPDFILYVPVSSGTIGAFVRAAVVKAQSHGRPLALLNLQYRELPAVTRYLNLYRFTDIVFAQSQASADTYRSLGCKTILLPSGVDHTIFRPVSKQEKRQLRLQYGFRDSDRIVLHIGHCKRDRNVMAFAKLAMAGFKAILVVSTSTTTDDDLLVELNQSGVVVMTNFIESIQHIYQMADCYVFPVFSAISAIDAPLSLLEAMACNIPVVTTRFGALPRMFQFGNGLYYLDTDDEIVDRVKQAIEENDCRTLELVAPYSWDETALTILKTFKEVRVADG